jgi:hypothetical protein
MGFQFSSSFLVDGLKDNPSYITSPGSSNCDSIAHNNEQGHIYSQVDRTNKTGK